MRAFGTAIHGREGSLSVAEWDCSNIPEDRTIKNERPLQSHGQSSQRGLRPKAIEYGGKFRKISLSSWPDMLCRSIFDAKCAFSFFVMRSIQCCRGDDVLPSSSALFPIPLPRDDVWGVALKKLGKSARVRRVFRKMMHLVILALNFNHFQAPLKIVPFLGRCPNRGVCAVVVLPMAFRPEADS